MQTLFREMMQNILNNKYFKDFKTFAIGYFVTSFISYLIVYFINNNLTPNELGKYSYHKSIFEISFVLISLTIYTSYLRFNINGASKKLFKFVIRIVIIATLIFAALIYYYTKDIKSILFALIILANERIYFFRSILLTTKLNLVRIVPAAITLALILGHVCFFPGSLSANRIFTYFGLGFAIVFFFYFGTFFSENEDFNYKDVLKYSIPAAAIVAMDYLLNMSAQIIIKQYYSYRDVAVFAVAQQSLLVIKLFSGVFLMFYPSIYFREINKKNGNFINKSRALIVGVIFVIIFLSFINAKLVYSLMGATKYSEHTSIYKILLLSELFKVMSSFLGLFLTYSLKVFINLMILTIGASLNFLLLYLFLNKMGLSFAAVSILISNIVVFLLYFLFSFRKEQLFLKNKT